MVYIGNNDWRDYLAHYGTPRHSGRYPWGSGQNPRAGTAKYYGGVAGGPKQSGDIKSSGNTPDIKSYNLSNATIKQNRELLKEAQRIATKHGYYDDLPPRGVIKEVDEIVDAVARTGLGKRGADYQRLSDKERADIAVEYDRYCSDEDKKRYVDESVELYRSVFHNNKTEDELVEMATRPVSMDNLHPVALYYIYQEKAKQQAETQLNSIKDEIKDPKEAEKVVAAARKDIEMYRLDKRESSDAIELRDLICMDHVDQWRKANKKKVFVSGSSKTTTEGSPYYRKELPESVRSALSKHIKNDDDFLVGDAPGIDTQVQNFLRDQLYKRVTVYATGEPRYVADKSWKIKAIDGGNYEPGSKEYLRQKDVAMTNDADEGIAVILDKGGAGATRNNVRRLLEQTKNVELYKINTDGTDEIVRDIIRELDSKKGA